MSTNARCRLHSPIARTTETSKTFRMTNFLVWLYAIVCLFGFCSCNHCLHVVSARFDRLWRLPNGRQPRRKQRRQKPTAFVYTYNRLYTTYPPPRTPTALLARSLYAMRDVGSERRVDGKSEDVQRLTNAKQQSTYESCIANKRL